MRLSIPHAKKGIILADIGEGGAACAVATDEKSGPLHVHALARTVPPLEERPAGDSITRLAQSLAESALQASKAHAERGAPHPSEIIAVVHAPWIRSRTIAVERTFPEETAITDTLIGDMAKEALTKDPALVREDMCEGSVVHIELNGYPTRTPHGKRAHQVKVVSLISEMQRAYREELEHALRQAFPEIPLRWRSHARALTSAVREHDDTSRNAVIFDVSDDGSSISVIRKHILTEQQHISDGVHSLLALLAPGGSREEILSILAMRERGTCDSVQCETIQAALTAAEPAITKRFGEALGEMAAQRRLPNDAYLIIHRDLAAWFAQFIARIDFAQFTLSSKPFMVKTLSADDLGAHAAFLSPIIPDLGIALAAALVHSERRS